MLAGDNMLSNVVALCQHDNLQRPSVTLDLLLSCSLTVCMSEGATVPNHLLLKVKVII